MVVVFNDTAQAFMAYNLDEFR